MLFILATSPWSWSTYPERLLALDCKTRWTRYHEYHHVCQHLTRALHLQGSSHNMPSSQCVLATLRPPHTLCRQSLQIDNNTFCVPSAATPSICSNTFIWHNTLFRGTIDVGFSNHCQRALGSLLNTNPSMIGLRLPCSALPDLMFIRIDDARKKGTVYQAWGKALILMGKGWRNRGMGKELEGRSKWLTYRKLDQEIEYRCTLGLLDWLPR